MKILKFTSILIVFLLSVISCDGLKIPKSIFETSERVKYERSFSGADSLLQNWKTNYSIAKNSQLQIKDGYTADVLPDSINLHALGYSLELKKGDLLIIETMTENSESKIFVDIIEENSNSTESKSELIKRNRLTQFIENSGVHKVIIQPEIEFNRNFKLRIYTQPSLVFPVAGKGNRDVQSFWGASRDGGGRSHEGVDIFAAKGTPVVAIADGFVTRTGNQGLGGKQVWLRDAALANSYYYAHLDSILTEDGRQVKLNDTLGWVGNTGNAAGGSPHLHFGIYTSGGAVDPYPYIRKRDMPKELTFTQKKFESEKYIKAGSNLRSGIGTDYKIVKNVTAKTRAQVLAISGSWVHVKTSDNIEGFVLGERLNEM